MRTTKEIYTSVQNNEEVPPEELKLCVESLRLITEFYKVLVCAIIIGTEKNGDIILTELLKYGVNFIDRLYNENVDTFLTPKGIPGNPEYEAYQKQIKENLERGLR